MPLSDMIEDKYVEPGDHAPRGVPFDVGREEEDQFADVVFFEGISASAWP
jgi:hypothetical protein